MPVSSSHCLRCAEFARLRKAYGAGAILRCSPFSSKVDGFAPKNLGVNLRKVRWEVGLQSWRDFEVAGGRVEQAELFHFLHCFPLCPHPVFFSTPPIPSHASSISCNKQAGNRENSIPLCPHEAIFKLSSCLHFGNSAEKATDSRTAAVERRWHTYDSQGQTIALTFKQRS